MRNSKIFSDKNQNKVIFFSSLVRAYRTTTYYSYMRKTFDFWNNPHIILCDRRKMFNFAENHVLFDEDDKYIETLFKRIVNS